MSKITKSQIEKAETKELRQLASENNVAFIGKKTEDLRAELLKIAEGGSAAAPVAKKEAVKEEKKEAAEAAAEKKAPAPKKEKKAPAPKKEKPAPAPRAERVPVGQADALAVEGLPTKKAKVQFLRALKDSTGNKEKYSLNAIAELVGLHPTNVARYCRDAGITHGGVTVPQERKDRIREAIAAKKHAQVVKAEEVKAQAVKAEEVKAQEVKAQEVKAAKKEAMATVKASKPAVKAVAKKEVKKAAPVKKAEPAKKEVKKAAPVKKAPAKKGKK